MIKRRHFLLGVGAAITAFAGLWAADVATKTEIAAAVRKRLGFLKLDEGGLDAFAKDQMSALLAKRPSWDRIKLHFDSLFSKPAEVGFGNSVDRRSRRERLEDHFSTVYLMSSDFFQHNADESRVIHYVALFDPERACDNPFARPMLGGRATAT